MDMESMKKLKSTVEKCLDELSQKSDLTPAETKAALDGMELREMLKCEIEDCKSTSGEKYDEGGYSGYDRPYRQYHITSFGHPIRVSYDDRSYRHSPMYSGDYGVQGWYRSDDGMSHCDNPYYYSMERRGGYSRHSLGDRVVEKLEHMMDSTDSNYEREELHKFIRMIRGAAD